ncbi:hypothetical protein FSP39_012272 [Pinctada imbricata]|uniref:Histone deacetylase complex subunit SAP130 C-terminal domain-containing protein n=1 Tax=Pinctada imbricata TaxID=66713 RepID=A0AA88YES3_PINIB|nr:hypothetical protein FSP39_012272 [Pinctada imbricata]
MSGQSSGEKATMPTTQPSVSTHQVTHAFNMPAVNPSTTSAANYQTLSKSLTRPINLSAAALGSMPVSGSQAAASALSAIIPNANAAARTTTMTMSTSAPSSLSKGMHISTSTVLHPSSIIQIGSTATLSIPAGSIPVSVSSILKGSAGQQSTALHQPSQQGTTAFPAHLPRGAVAAASALAGPKSSMTAVPIVRHPVSSSQQPSSASSLQSHIGQRASLITPVIRSGNPPSAAARPTSPAITSAQAMEVQRGTISIQTSSTPSTVGSIQITVPASRTITDMSTKPLITQHPKQISQIGPQKILMSQSPTSTILQQSLAANLSKTNKVPNQNPNLTASLQAATAHGLSVTTASAVRFNHLNPSQMMVTVDALRQQQAALSANTPFTNASQSTSSDSHRPSTPTDSLSSLSSVAISSSAIPIPALSALAVGHTPTYPQNTPSTPQHGSHSSNTAVSTPSASPRPSILRKRPTNEGPVKKPVCGLNALLDRHSPRPDSRTDSAPQSNNSSPKTPHTPAGESQSSTDTALSSEATTPTQNSTSDIKIKQEPPDQLLENGFSPSISQGISSLSNSLPNSVEASPRKKPRKQLLNANEELKDTISSSEDDDEDDKLALDIKDEGDVKQEYRGEYVDDDGIRWTVEKCRPNVSLMNFYNLSWKSRNNHFQRYGDVKSKEERRPTVNELSNQRAVMQKASGWKLYHMAAQMEDLNELEKTLHSKLSAVQAAIAPHPPSKLNMMEDDLGMLHELTQANIQRSQLIMDQLQESRANMLKVLDHKQKIIEIINKHMSKRPIKKKERS